MSCRHPCHGFPAIEYEKNKRFDNLIYNVYGWSRHVLPDHAELAASEQAPQRQRPRRQQLDPPSAARPSALTACDNAEHCHDYYSPSHPEQQPPPVPNNQPLSPRNSRPTAPPSSSPSRRPAAAQSWRHSVLSCGAGGIGTIATSTTATRSTVRRLLLCSYRLR